MVHLVLVSSKGNNVRYFPYTGYLGLTPVKVEGVVCTKRDVDLKTLQAKSITVSVRCYESRLGRLGTLQTNIVVDHTQILWSKPEGQDYGALGDAEYPFRITLPATVGGYSTVSFVEYKCIWRVEAVLNHAHITGVGSRQVKHVDLPLVRYDVPPNLPAYGSSHHEKEPKFTRQVSKPRGPRLDYSLKTPKFPIGPTDLVSIPIHILPHDPNVAIRSATLLVERRITFSESVSPTSIPSSSSPFNPQQPQHTSQSVPTTSSIHIPHRYSASSSSLALSSSYTNDDTFSSKQTITSTTALLRNGNPSQSSDSLSARVVVTPVAGTESSGPFTRSSSGIWSKTVTFQWPSVKSSGRWGIGETIQSEIVTVKFYVRLKVIITSPSGTDSLELDEEELFVVSTNDSERRIAAAKYEDAHSSRSRSKSKSPRRTRRERENAPEPPVPSTSAADQAHHHASFSPASLRPSPNKTPRRPHTSAGPRDKSANPRDSSYGRLVDTYRPNHHDREEESSPYKRKLRPGTVTSPEITRSSASGLVYSRRTSTSNGSGGLQRNDTYASSASGSTSPSVSSITAVSTNIRDSADIREWEEELARIEVQSRRSSDLLGFGLRRKQSSIAVGRPTFLKA